MVVSNTSVKRAVVFSFTFILLFTFSAAAHALGDERIIQQKHSRAFAYIALDAKGNPLCAMTMNGKPGRHPPCPAGMHNKVVAGINETYSTTRFALRAKGTGKSAGPVAVGIAIACFAGGVYGASELPGFADQERAAIDRTNSGLMVSLAVMNNGWSYFKAITEFTPLLEKAGFPRTAARVFAGSICNVPTLAGVATYAAYAKWGDKVSTFLVGYFPSQGDLEPLQGK